MEFTPLREEKKHELAEFSKNSHCVEHSKRRKVQIVSNLKNFHPLNNLQFLDVFSENRKILDTMNGHHVKTKN